MLRKVQITFHWTMFKVFLFEGILFCSDISNRAAQWLVDSIEIWMCPWRSYFRIMFFLQSVFLLQVYSRSIFVELNIIVMSLVKHVYCLIKIVILMLFQIVHLLPNLFNIRAWGEKSLKLNSFLNFIFFLASRNALLNGAASKH